MILSKCNTFIYLSLFVTKYFDNTNPFIPVNFIGNNYNLYFSLFSPKPVYHLLLSPEPLFSPKNEIRTNEKRVGGSFNPFWKRLNAALTKNWNETRCAKNKNIFSLFYLATTRREQSNGKQKRGWGWRGKQTVWNVNNRKSGSNAIDPLCSVLISEECIPKICLSFRLPSSSSVCPPPLLPFRKCNLFRSNFSFQAFFFV